MPRQLLLLLLITALASLVRLWRLDIPASYMFDEVYHVVSAQSYAQNDPAGYEWWHSSPKPGTAYEWLHPPVAKLFQAFGIVVLGDWSFSWRILSTVFGVASIPLLYLLAVKLLKNNAAALLAAFLWSIDWLMFVQSRIAMNDIFVTFFVILTACLFVAFWQEYPKGWLRNILLVSIGLGLAVSTKWSGVYIVLPLSIFSTVILARVSHPRGVMVFRLGAILSSLVCISLILYVLSYGQWWLQGHTWSQFRQLHQQIWWYQTNLKATHGYQSPAWSWPLASRPVWYQVEYQPAAIGNIYAMGNPLAWWPGLFAACYALVRVFRNRMDRFALAFLFVCYIIFWIPWIFSPRIMFLYHYLPALPFLYIMLSYVLVKKVSIQYIIWYATLLGILFLFYLPHLNGLPVPRWLDNLYYWFPSWK